MSSLIWCWREPALTLAEVADAWASLRAACQTRDSGADLLLDLRAVGEIDGAGLQLLWQVEALAGAQGVACRLQASAAVVAALRLTGIRMEMTDD